MMWTESWFWFVGAILLAALEVFVPAYLFLGFAIGAAIVGFLYLVGGTFTLFISSTLSLTLLTFALASFFSWIILRKLLGVREGQVKIIDRDINDH